MELIGHLKRPRTLSAKPERIIFCVKTCADLMTESKHWRGGDGVLFVYNATNMEKNRNWSDVPMHYGNPVMMNDTDRARLLEACKMQRAKFEKRLQAYLKRYGLSKIKKWTYWDNE